MRRKLDDDEDDEGEEEDDDDDDEDGDCDDLADSFGWEGWDAMWHPQDD